MLFKNTNSSVSISEVRLKKDYAFMYENFIVSSQQTLFLLLEENDNIIDALKFKFLIYKYGYPNDEVSHPMAKFGLGSYGLFKVTNSPWLTDLRNNNRSHHRHTDSLFDRYNHYIAKFKDLTFEVICITIEEVQISKVDLFSFVEEEINNIKK